MWQLFLMYALFGSVFTVGKIGMEGAQPFFLTGIRMCLAGLLIMGYLFYTSSLRVALTKRDWQFLFLIALFNVFLTNAFEFWGLQYMSAGKTCLIYSLAPFVAALMGYCLGTEQMKKKKWVGLGIGFLAVCPMMLLPWLNEQVTNSQSMELFAEGALTIAAISSVLGWNFVKKLIVERQLPHPFINGISFLLAGAMSLFTSSLTENWNPLPVFDWSKFLWALLYIVLIHNIICYSICAASLKRFSVTFLSFIGLSTPLFAALFGWVFLDEPIATTFWIALIGISVGLYLFYQEEKQNTLVLAKSFN